MTVTNVSETYDTTAAIKASEICDSMNHIFQTDPEVLITRLSFTHIREIMRIDDPLERFFYEFECIKGVWSVRELKRQIASKLYFRTGISKKPELLFDHIQNNDPASILPNFENGSSGIKTEDNTIYKFAYPSSFYPILACWLKSFSYSLALLNSRSYQ